MIRAGLYAPGSDAVLDEAIRVWPALDSFLAEGSPDGPAGAFARLARCLSPKGRVGQSAGTVPAVSTDDGGDPAGGFALDG